MLLSKLFFARCLSLSLMLMTSNVFAKEKLIFSFDIVRHGDRTPIHLLPKAPAYPWQDGTGQLTPRGMREEYELGLKLRQQYVVKTHLLPPKYQRETLYVRSTDYDRTLMSATSLLMGLYPPGSGPNALPHAYQPIPIHSRAKADDVLLVPNEQKSQRLRQQYVFVQPAWQEKNASLQPYYADWSAVTGMQITNLDKLVSLGNTLSINERYHAPQPPGLSREDIERIIAAGRWALVARYRPPQVGEECGRPLLQWMSTYVQRAMRHQSPLKYFLILAHDTTLLSVMNALKVPLNTPPGYASRFHLGVYELSPNEHRIAVMYNGHPVPLPGCDGALCTFNQFRNAFSKTEKTS